MHENNIYVFTFWKSFMFSHLHITEMKMWNSDALWLCERIERTRCDFIGSSIIEQNPKPVPFIIISTTVATGPSYLSINVRMFHLFPKSFNFQSIIIIIYKYTYYILGE